MKLTRRSVVGGAAAMLSSPPVFGQDMADFAMSIGLDRSNSMSVEEQITQRNGLAWAIRNPKFAGAVQGGRHGRALINVFTFKSSGMDQIIPWLELRTAEDIEHFAQIVDGIGSDMPLNGQYTNVYEAMLYGVQSVVNSPVWAERLLVNICGDGHNSDNMVSLKSNAPAHTMAMQYGVVINGLSIGEQEVADFYNQKVSTPNGFNIHVNTVEEFGEGFLRKFQGEIA